MPAKIDPDQKDYLGPVSASPQYVAEALIPFANLTSKDILFDLGCNDGRVVLTTAKSVGLKGVGIELDPDAAAKAQKNVLAEQLQARVSIICGNALEADISQATVIFLYLLPKGMTRLMHKLQSGLQPGCRIVSYMFKMPGWEAYYQQSQSVSPQDKSRMDVSAVSKLHLYCLPTVIQQRHLASVAS